jgi:hypothetical protein
MIEQDLFRTILLVRMSGRIGTNRQEKVEEFASEREAGPHGTVVSRVPSCCSKTHP